MGLITDHKLTNLCLDYHCFDPDLFPHNFFLIYENIFLFTSTSNSTGNAHTALGNFEWRWRYTVANSIQKTSFKHVLLVLCFHIVLFTLLVSQDFSWNLGMVYIDVGFVQFWVDVRLRKQLNGASYLLLEDNQS